MKIKIELTKQEAEEFIMARYYEYYKDKTFGYGDIEVSIKE